MIGKYVHKDQVSFIPNRQGPDQIRRAIDIVPILQSGWDGYPRQAGMLLSLDLQKAFDSLLWSYLFTVLEHWGFGPRFSDLLRSLYSTPVARIRLQGTHQGCPLIALDFRYSNGITCNSL